VQEEQLVLKPSVQVVHEASQVVQIFVEKLLYCPSGQTETQVFLDVSKNKLPEHDTHSVLEGPEHVLQVTSHPRHCGSVYKREGKRAGSQVETHDLVAD